MDRRACIRWGLAGAVSELSGAGAIAAGVDRTRSGIAAPVLPSSVLPAPRPLAELRMYIPGGAGGGWDQTGRALGAAIQTAGLAQRVSYENKGGKGGTVGLAEFVQKYDQDPAALLVGGMVMVGALALGQHKVTLADVSPICRLTSDYGAIVVPADSRLASFKDLVKELQRDVASVVFTGGSLGGVDHMLAGMMVRQLRLDVARLRYEPTSSGRDAIAMLASGKAQVAISSYSEFKAEIDKKAVLPLAVSSRRALFGIPSLVEQGVATEMANWRAVFAAGGIAAADKDNLRAIVLRATETPAWRQSLQDANWIAATLHGKDFADSLGIEQAMANAVTMMLKLKG